MGSGETDKKYIQGKKKRRKSFKELRQTNEKLSHVPPKKTCTSNAMGEKKSHAN